MSQPQMMRQKTTIVEPVMVPQQMPRQSSDLKINPDRIVTPSHDYHKTLLRTGRYKYDKVPPIEGDTATITTTSTLNRTFTISGDSVFNPSKVRMGWNKVYAAAATAGVHNSWENTEGYIQRVQTGDNNATGVLMDLQDAAYLLSYIRGFNTPMEKFLEQDVAERLYPIRSSGAAGYSPGQYPDGTAASVPFNEPCKFVAGLNNADLMARSVMIPMSAFVHSFWALDKDVYFGKNIKLTVTFDNSTAAGWCSTSTVNPATGAAVENSALTLSDMNLYIAIQQDQDICNQVKARFLKGETTIFQRCRVDTKVSTAATSQSVQIPIGPEYGRYINRIYHTVSADATTNATYGRFDNSNLNGSKIQTYQTKLGSELEQNQVINCTSANSEPFGDYQHMKPMLKGTVYGNRASYQMNWAHCSIYDGLTQADKEELNISKDNIVSGIKVDKDFIWYFNGTSSTATAWVHRTFVVGLFRFRLNGNFIEVM